jgi:hypothetical protein
MSTDENHTRQTCHSKINHREEIAFIIPTTTHGRSWESIQDTFLYNILLGSLNKYPPHIPISLYFGYDKDDPILSKLEERLSIDAIFDRFKFNWISFTPDKGNVTRIWNQLADKAIADGFEYLLILGDDIKFPNDRGWLNLFKKQLKKNNNIGWSAGWSNNDQIATQFLIHKTHIEIFGFVFPPQIRNWFCDNWLNDIYPDKYCYWRKDYPLLNCGGDPRYIPNDDEKLCSMLVKRHKPSLHRFISQQ